MIKLNVAKNEVHRLVIPEFSIFVLTIYVERFMSFYEMFEENPPFSPFLGVIRPWRPNDTG